MATLAARPSRGSSLAISDVAALERSSGSAELRFTVELSGGGEDAVSVAYSTADETASAADDYAAVSGTLALGRSRPTGIVSVTIVPDALDELDETLTVRLSNGSGAEIADAVGLGSILDDDGGVTGPTIAAAGDIACDPGSSDFAGGQGSGLACRQLATSDLLLSGGYDAVFVLGDVQYGDGALSKFRASYDPSWGRAKAITRPVPGNHEYETASGGGLLRVLRRAAGDPAKGYYSFQIGSWHVDRAQLQLLGRRRLRGGIAAGDLARADLAAHSAAKCTLAYWHHPRFSSGAHGGDSAYERRSSAGAVRRQCRPRPRGARPRLRALRAAEPERRARPRPRDPPVRRRHRREGAAPVRDDPAEQRVAQLLRARRSPAQARRRRVRVALRPPPRDVHGPRPPGPPMGGPLAPGPPPPNTPPGFLICGPQPPQGREGNGGGGPRPPPPGPPGPAGALFEIRRMIAGQDAMLERVLVCLLAQGHLLIEGVRASPRR